MNDADDGKSLADQLVADAETRRLVDQLLDGHGADVELLRRIVIAAGDDREAYRGPDELRQSDRFLLRRIMMARTDNGDAMRLVHAYYSDLDRADRTPRPFLYLHLGLLIGILRNLDDH